MHATATSPRRRPGVRSKLIGASIVVTAVLVATAGSASAHVEAEGDTAPSGITTVTFSFHHGCGDSPTTSLKVELPTGTTEVTPQDPAGFTSTVTAGTLTWSGGSVPADATGTFVADLRIVGTAGDTVFLPTIQGCVDGQEDWIEKTDDPEADDAAPRIILTQTVEPTSTTTSTTAADATTTTQATSSTEAASDSTEPGTVADTASSDSPLPLVIFIGVIAVIVIGGLVLYLRNRKPGSGSGSGSDSGTGSGPGSSSTSSGSEPPSGS
jgi:uncharacterized protein YcnI